MPSDPTLTLATPDEVAQSLSFALRFNGRKRALTGDEFMAMQTAERLIEHLRVSGFVIMKKPPALPHSSPPFVPRP